MKKVKFTDIVWDTDNIPTQLPQTVVLEMEEDSDVWLEGADTLSDEYGFCVKRFNFEVL